MILFQTSMSEETLRYQILPLPNQPFAKSLKRNIEDIKITAPMADFASKPLGSIFITDGYDFPEPDHLHVRKENVVALIFQDMVFPMSHLDKNRVQELGDYAVDYFIDHSDFGIDYAKNVSSQLSAYGYECDWDSKITPKPAVGEALPSGTNIRRTIAASFPVPKTEEVGFHIDPDMWFLLCRNVLRGENTLLVGPTGLTTMNA